MNGLTRLGWCDVAAMISIVLCFSTDLLELFFELFQVLVRKPFKIDKFISRAFDGANNLIKFQMNGFGIAVLGVLNQEHHQKCDDGRAGINNQLPSVRKMKRWSGGAPYYDDKNSHRECPRAAQDDRGIARENAKRVLDNTKKIPGPFVFF